MNFEEFIGSFNDHLVNYKALQKERDELNERVIECEKKIELYSRGMSEIHSGLEEMSELPIRTLFEKLEDIKRISSELVNEEIVKSKVESVPRIGSTSVIGNLKTMLAKNGIDFDDLQEILALKFEDGPSPIACRTFILNAILGYNLEHFGYLDVMTHSFIDVQDLLLRKGYKKFISCLSYGCFRKEGSVGFKVHDVKCADMSRNGYHNALDPKHSAGAVYFTDQAFYVLDGKLVNRYAETALGHRKYHPLDYGTLRIDNYAIPLKKE